MSPGSTGGPGEGRLSSAAHAYSVVAEALAAARAAPVVSLLVIVMIAGMCAAVGLTKGRAVATERSIIASIDRAGTRSIVISARPGTALDSAISDRASAISDVEWIGTVRFVSDGRNLRIPGGATVPVQSLWASSWAPVGLPQPTVDRSRQAYASSLVLDRVGLADGIGRLQLDDQSTIALAGPVDLPDRLASLASSVILTEPDSSRSREVDKVFVVVRTSDRVEAVAHALSGLLNGRDISNATISTSKQLALVRQAVQGELGNASRALALLITAVTAALACAVLVLSVLQRRRDFGRRRALGASRTLIAGLVLVQCGALGLVGCAVGNAVAVGVLVSTRAAVPGPEYLAAISVLAIGMSVVASLPAALLASVRDPVAELRVP